MSKDERRYYTPPPPENKPARTIRLRYVGESFGVDSLTNGKIYEAWTDEGNNDDYRVIDDSGEDYLYSRINPAPRDGSSPGGRWEFIGEEDAE